MKKWLVLALMFAGNLAFAASAREDAVERLQMTTDVLHQLVNAPDKGIPQEVIDNAKCIVVVPHLVKGGFIVGGKHGRGVATCRVASDWSAPAFVSVGGGSWGLQIGVEGVDLVMFIMNDKGLEHLLSSKFEITGEGSAAAGPVGRHASMGTDWKLNTQMLTYSRSKGAFAGLTLEGAVIQNDDDSTLAIYRKNASFRSILMGKIRAPTATQAFLRTVNDVSKNAHRQEAAETGKK